jgi:hypothetical protein
MAFADDQLVQMRVLVEHGKRLLESEQRFETGLRCQADEVASTVAPGEPKRAFLRVLEVQGLGQMRRFDERQARRECCRRGCGSVTGGACVRQAVAVAGRQVPMADAAAMAVLAAMAFWAAMAFVINNIGSPPRRVEIHCVNLNPVVSNELRSRSWPLRLFLRCGCPVVS